MVLFLRDDLILETFDSPDLPPIGVEWIDVENDEYAFCSDKGQRYRGEIIRAEGFFRPAQWKLVPDGKPDMTNAFALVNRAVGVDPDRCEFGNIETAIAYLQSGEIFGR